MRLGLILGLQAFAAAFAQPMATPAMTLASCNGAHATTLHASANSSSDARAVWLNRSQIRWPKLQPVAATATQVKLYFSARGGLQTTLGKPVRGADAAITLQANRDALANEFNGRFGYLDALGVTLSVVRADQKKLSQWQRGQLMLVFEAQASGHVIDATALQLAGYMDDVNANAESL